MDYDDWAVVLPPEEVRKVVELIGPAGAPITDVLIDGIDFETNHLSGAAEMKVLRPRRVGFAPRRKK